MPSAGDPFLANPRDDTWRAVMGVAWGVELIVGIVLATVYWRRRWSPVIAVRSPHLILLTFVCLAGTLFQSQWIFFPDQAFYCKQYAWLLVPAGNIAYFGLFAVSIYRILHLIAKFERARMQLYLKLRAEGHENVAPLEHNFWQRHLTWLTSKWVGIALFVFVMSLPLYRYASQSMRAGPYLEACITVADDDVLETVWIVPLVLGMCLVAWKVRTVEERWQLVQELKWQGVCGVFDTAVFLIFPPVFDWYDQSALSDLETLVVVAVVFWVTFWVPLRQSYAMEREQAAARDGRGLAAAEQLDVPPELNTFHGLLSSTPGRHSFAEYLALEFAIENLMFVEAVEELQRWKPDPFVPPPGDDVTAEQLAAAERAHELNATAEAKRQAHELYRRFVARDAPFEVNLRYETAHALHRAFRVRKPKRPKRLNELQRLASRSSVVLGKSGSANRHAVVVNVKHSTLGVPATATAAAAAAGGPAALDTSGASSAAPGAAAADDKSRTPSPRNGAAAVVVGVAPSAAADGGGAAPSPIVSAAPRLSTVGSTPLLAGLLPAAASVTAAPATASSVTPGGGGVMLPAAAAGSGSSGTGSGKVLPPKVAFGAPAAVLNPANAVVVKGRFATVGGAGGAGAAGTVSAESSEHKGDADDDSTRNAAYYLSLFDAAHREIYHLLESDSYGRYLRSPHFERLVTSVLLAKKLAAEQAAERSAAASPKRSSAPVVNAAAVVAAAHAHANAERSTSFAPARSTNTTAAAASGGGGGGAGGGTAPSPSHAAQSTSGSGAAASYVHLRGPSGVGSPTTTSPALISAEHKSPSLMAAPPLRKPPSGGPDTSPSATAVSPTAAAAAGAAAGGVALMPPTRKVVLKIARTLPIAESSALTQSDS